MTEKLLILRVTMFFAPQSWEEMKKYFDFLPVGMIWSLPIGRFFAKFPNSSQFKC